MNFLLDTGIVIRHLRDDKRAHDLLDYLEGTGAMRVSVITLLEVLVGCRSPDEEHKSLLLFERIMPLAVSGEIAQKGASLIRDYPAIFGRSVQRGTPDALIAATAWQQGSNLITLNTRQFATTSMAEIAVQALDQNARDWVAALKLGLSR